MVSGENLWILIIDAQEEIKVNPRPINKSCTITLKSTTAFICVICSTLGPPRDVESNSSAGSCVFISFVSVSLLKV